MLAYNVLKCLTFTLFLSAQFLTTGAQLENSTRPEVTIPQGTMLGTTFTTRNGRNISAFLGIPYGQPPVGALRFANPVAAGGWNETLDASTDANMCPQIGGGPLSVLGDEDCLYINVYTPQGNSSGLLLPVMVHIHGGAFQSGSSASTVRSPQFLMDKDIVLVAGNYRVGLLGFLSTGDEVASGNWGLKDQTLALQWVQSNIEYFGGDPSQVTLFGESAGGASIHLLSLSDATIGLFHRYITESGSGLGTWAHRPREAYASRAFEIGEYVGCSNNTSAALISCLRAMNFSYILNMDAQFPNWQDFANLIWGPTDELDIEGAMLTDSPSNLVAAGRVRDLPWISGVTRDEGLLMTMAYYMSEEAFNDFLENFDDRLRHLLSWVYIADSGEWLEAVKSYYFNNDLTTNRTELLANLTILISDSQFIYPAYKGVQQQLAFATSPAYFYTFNYRSNDTVSDLWFDGPPALSVGHAEEIRYLFPLDFSNSNDLSSINEMVDIIVELWTSFAIDGTPSTSAINHVTIWDRYSAEDNYLRIGNGYDAELEMQYSFHSERMRFWADLESGSVTNTANFISVMLLSSLVILLINK